MDKQNVVYIFNGMLFSNKKDKKKKKNLAQATIWINLENITLSEKSQSPKAKYDPICIKYPEYVNSQRPKVDLY